MIFSSKYYNYKNQKQMLLIVIVVILLVKILEVENAIIKKYKWDILGDFQTMCVCPVEKTLFSL